MHDSVFLFCKHKTAYEMRISDWSSDVCSSDLNVDCGRANRQVVGARKGGERAEQRRRDPHDCQGPQDSSSKEAWMLTVHGRVCSVLCLAQLSAAPGLTNLTSPIDRQSVV